MNLSSLKNKLELFITRKFELFIIKNPSNEPVHHMTVKLANNLLAEKIKKSIY